MVVRHWSPKVGVGPEWQGDTAGRRGR